MATVNVTEFSDTGGGMPGVASEAPVISASSVVTMQALTTGGAASAAFSASTALVEVSSDTACHVAFTPIATGATPTAADPSFLIPASTPRQFGVRKGMKVIAF